MSVSRAEMNRAERNQAKPANRNAPHQVGVGGGPSKQPQGLRTVHNPPPLLNPGSGGWSLDPEVIENENPKENPCNCCCNISIAARLLAIMNLLCLKSFLIFFAFGSDPSKSVYPEAKSEETKLFERCFVGNRVKALHDGHHISAILLVNFAIPLNSLVDLGFTILFIIAVFASPKIKRRIAFSNMYMWYNLFYPGAILWTLYIIVAVTKYEDCEDSDYLWLWYFAYLTVIVPWSICTGLVARAYRNALERGTYSVGSYQFGGMTAAPTTANGTGEKQVSEMEPKPIIEVG